MFIILTPPTLCLYPHSIFLQALIYEEITVYQLFYDKQEAIFRRERLTFIDYGGSNPLGYDYVNTWSHLSLWLLLGTRTTARNSFPYQKTKNTKKKYQKNKEQIRTKTKDKGTDFPKEDDKGDGKQQDYGESLIYSMQHLPLLPSSYSLGCGRWGIAS